MRIHLVPNSHIDPVWLWDKYEGIDEVINTFRSACDRLDEYPDLTFSASSLQFYEWVLAYDKPLFKRIKKHVESGRWEISGGWWVESDSNLLLESSFRKHAELSKNFAMEHFNTDIKTAFLPDTFGHPATLPKILAETGFRYFIFCRPDTREKQDLPSNLFYWEYEGHKVLAYRLKHHYTLNPDENKLKDEEYKKNETNCFFFGVGDHGGGPTVQEIEFYNKFMKENPGCDIGYSTCERFFEEAEKNVKNIPVYRGDLHMHAVGCYSVVSDLKAKIRLSEHSLELAERALNMAGKKSESLDESWKTTLFNQFHDILPGSCSPAAAEQAKDELGGAISKSLELTYDSFKKLTGKRRVKAKEGEFRVFNTLDFPVTAPFSIESSSYFRGNVPFVDETKKQIEIQKISPSVRTTFSFKWEFIDTLPAQSFKSYFFDSPVVQKSTEQAVNFFTPGKKIETPSVSISAGGLIESKTGGNIFKAPISFPVIDDTSDTWGHGIRRYDNVIGSFKPVSSSVATGPISSKIFEKYAWGKSEIDVLSSIYNSLPGIYIEIKVKWGERRKILKFELDPAVITGDSFMMQGAGGAITRKTDGVELPLHHWIWLPRSGNSGLAVIQDGAFACDCSNGRLRITLARSSMYGFHDPFKLNDYDPEYETDQGLHTFKFRIFPDEIFDKEALDRKAKILIEPFHVVREGWRN